MRSERTIPIDVKKYRATIAEFVNKQGYTMNTCSKVIPRVTSATIYNDQKAGIISAKRKMQLENAGVDTSLFCM